jgi:hypothetical protein
MNCTLTHERVFEVAPFSAWEREALLRWREEGPAYVWNVISAHAWRQILLWYKNEANRIGEEETFWNVVFRILDEPTADDVELIRTILEMFDRHYSA